MWYEGHVEGFEWFSGSPGGWVSWWGDGARIGRFGTRTKQIRSETLSIHRNLYRKIIEATSMKMAMMMMMAMMMVAAVGAAELGRGATMTDGKCCSWDRQIQWGQGSGPGPGGGMAV